MNSLFQLRIPVTHVHFLTKATLSTPQPQLSSSILSMVHDTYFQFRRRKERLKIPSLQLKLVPEAIQAPADRPILAPVLAATNPS
jgi:hypothetical protein